MRDRRRAGGWHGLLLAALLMAGCEAGAPDASPPPIRLFEGLGGGHRPISTRSPDAQRYFDQGLALVYAFNHEAAVRSFRAALGHDPGCAICLWGIATALGPNLNAPMGPDAAREAWAAVEAARARAATASPVERDLIEAVARRYAADPDTADRAALDLAYAEAMREVAKRHPGDLDVAALAAEALLDLSPWDYWVSPSEPKPNLREALGLLEGVLATRPDHLGANHFLIHAVEEHAPERALASAERLAALAPAAGHLVHMPSHIFWRLGRYEDAFEINRAAAAADEATIGWCGRRAPYTALYTLHNLHFLAAAAGAEGRGDLALSSARGLVAQIDDAQLREFPAVEEFLAMPTFALLRFGRFDAVLGAPAPPASQRYATGIWHYARGLAHARRGEAARADAEREALRAAAAEPALAELVFSGVPASRYLELAYHHLDGEIAAANGDTDAAVVALEAAIRIQDAMQYTEPPRWWLPVRQSQGAVLVAAGRAPEAEAVYREDLRRNPRNGWSLFGLARSLEAQGREAEAAAVDAGFRHAWARADVALTASRL